MTQFEVLLSALQNQNVSFIIIGGVAATLHGSARLTNDLDVVYDRSPENIERLVINLDALIRSKRATGRAKDLEVVAELEAIREERDSQS